jgi:hypothetical protein
MMENEEEKMLDLKKKQIREFALKPNKTPEEQEVYNIQLLNALGASSMEEAMSIAQLSGLSSSDIPDLLASTVLMQPP